jgi:hypothetical protein
MPPVNQLNSLKTLTEFATSRMYVCSIMAMHPKGMGRYTQVVIVDSVLYYDAVGADSIDRVR